MDNTTLRKRAENFLKVAKILFKDGIYDLSAFNVEQFCQLLLKSKLEEISGAFPKTHSINILLRELGKILGKLEDVEKFTLDNISTISNIEKSYITSRYVPFDYSKEEVETMLKFAEELKKLVNTIEK